MSPWGLGWPTPWDAGVSWHLEQSAAEGPDWAADPLSLEFVRDQHLKTSSDNAEDEYVTRLIRTSYRIAEQKTLRSLIPQGRRLVLDRFPCWEIVVPHPPLLSVDRIDYIDENGDTQSLSGSPAQFLVSAPDGPHARRGRITPLYSDTWPATRGQLDAVVVHFNAGYPIVGDAAVADIPDDITHGRLLVIGELYKQRSESVHAFNQNPALIRARDLFVNYLVY